MEEAKKFSFTIGSVIIIGAFFLILTIVGYKYNEYITLKKYVDSYNDNWKKEFELTESVNENYNEFLEIIDKNASNSATTTEANDYSEEIIAINLIENNGENYLKTLEKNRDKLAKKPINEELILGSKGSFIKQLRDLQIRYYDLELDRTKKTQSIAHYYQDAYPVLLDLQVMEEYAANGEKNAKKFIDDFANLQSIEKYSEPDYKFSHEDEVRKYYPKAQELLDNYKRYLGAYYGVVKDYIAEDYESVEYKNAGIQDIDLLADWDELFKDNQEEESVKNIIEIVRDQSQLIKEFELRNGLKVPFIGSIGNFEEDIVICQLYDFKANELYFIIKNEYPSATTESEFIKELSTVSPRTDEIDELFDESSMRIDNQKDKLVVICKNSKGFSYKSTTFKE